jgi:hypothetical protein
MPSSQLGTADASLRSGQRVSVGLSRQSGARGSLVLTVGLYPGTAAQPAAAPGRERGERPLRLARSLLSLGPSRGRRR